MNIAILCRPVSPPWDSGSKNFAFNVAKELAERGHHVYLPVLSGFIPNIDNITCNPIYPEDNFNLKNKLRLFKFVFSLRNIDVLHFFFGVTPLTMFVVKILQKITNTATILSITHIPKRNINLIDYITGNNIALTVYSAHLKKKFHRAAPDVVYPGVDLSNILAQQSANIDATRKKYGIDSTAELILFGGEFTWKSGNDTLIKTIQNVLSSKKHIVFVLASRVRTDVDRTEKKRITTILQDFINDKTVVILETVPDMHNLINASDICILPVVSSCYKVDIPVFIIEAMLYEKPVIISDFPPINETFQEFSPGRLVPAGDNVSLTRTIISMLKNKKRFQGEGKKCVEKHYNLVESVKQYEKIYKRITNE